MTPENETASDMRGVVVLLLSDCIIYSSGKTLTSENETQSTPTLCSVHANAPPAWQHLPQPALHMTAGFRDQREEVMRQAVAGPRLMKRSLPLSGALREVFTVQPGMLCIYTLVAGSG